MSDLESSERKLLIARLNRIRSSARRTSDDMVTIISRVLVGIEKVLEVDGQRVCADRHLDVIICVLQAEVKPLSAAQIKKILEGQGWLSHVTHHVRRAAVNGGLDRAVKRGLITSQGSVKSRRFAISHSD